MYRHKRMFETHFKRELACAIANISGLKPIRREPVNAFATSARKTLFRRELDCAFATVANLKHRGISDRNLLVPWTQVHV